jgi:2-polyprenyl-6-methoxyphenol hydroxylase-like FAD-dependent oxidoreductase
MVGQVVRMMDRRGLCERLTGTPGPPRPTPQFMFAAFPLDLAQLPDNPVYTVLVPQRKLEQVLAERAAELGVEIRRGHELTGLTQTGDAVIAELSNGDKLTAPYLVGADGGRSEVRKLAGIGFPGVTRDRTVSRTAHVSVPPEYVDPRSGVLLIPGYGPIPGFLHHRTERGLVAWALMPGRPALLSVNEQGDADESVPFGLDELRDAFRSGATRGWPTGTATGGCSWSATPPTCTRRWAAPASTSACRTRSTSAGSWPGRSTAGRRRACSTRTSRNAGRSPPG